jgi:hypothetical protein
MLVELVFPEILVVALVVLPEGLHVLKSTRRISLENVCDIINLPA